MQRIVIGSPTERTVHYESRVSSTWDLINLLPFVTLSRHYPGLDPWAHTIADRVTAEEQEDFSLITWVLYRSVGHLGFPVPRYEDLPAFLEQFDALTEEQLQLAVLKGCIGEESPAPDEAAALLQQPERLRAMIQGSPGPVPDEELAVDVDRILRLVTHPHHLKQLLSTRLRELWEQHLKAHWERSLPALNRSVAEARRHFAAGGPEQVIQAVSGRSLPDEVRSMLPDFRSCVFYPSAILGPYLSLIISRNEGTLRVMYGAGIQSGTAEPAPALAGGMLPALTALADETRMQMLDLIRSRGRGCAQDFMAEMGLSQPATSRHLRLLESTGVLMVERVEGVKWYRINPARARQVAESIQRFLLGG